MMRGTIAALSAVVTLWAAVSTAAECIPLNRPDADRAAIVWKADWDATLQANAAAWGGEKRAVLLEAIPLRPEFAAAARRAEAGLELANLLANAGDWDRAAHWAGAPSRPRRTTSAWRAGCSRCSCAPRMTRPSSGRGSSTRRRNANSAGDMPRRSWSSDAERASELGMTKDSTA